MLRCESNSTSVPQFGKIGGGQGLLLATDALYFAVLLMGESVGRIFAVLATPAL